eukprot:COSAG06_NODE_1123_length_10626_cov_2.836991_2_plen_73_part_00
MEETKGWSTQPASETACMLALKQTNNVFDDARTKLLTNLSGLEAEARKHTKEAKVSLHELMLRASLPTPAQS